MEHLGTIQTQLGFVDHETFDLTHGPGSPCLLNDRRVDIYAWQHPILLRITLKRTSSDFLVGFRTRFRGPPICVQCTTLETLVAFGELHI